MPSRKQRRRRDKLKRHEYEYVIETETGEEIAVERPRELEKDKDGRNGRPQQGRGPIDRRGRPIPEPSLRRVLRRGAIFAPVIAVLTYVISQDSGNVAGTVVFNTVLLLAFFLPFSYMVDVFVYRMMKRRQERERGR
ncbi:MAG: hypothetical protein ACRDON_01670 [Gaiellaceae bacterium]